jgi:hypothetical protein
MRSHENEYNIVLKKEYEKKSDPKQTTLHQFYPSDKKIVISMTSTRFKEAVVDMVIESGAPFKLFSSDGFKELIGEMAAQLSVSLDPSSVRKYVMEAAMVMKEDIKRELQGKMVYLKFDCCTRMERSFLGLHVRYVDPDTGIPVTKTLLVSDTLSRHTSCEQKKVLLDTLEEFGIPVTNVLCCVVDNATNMVKMVNQELVAGAEAMQPSSDLDEFDDDWDLEDTSIGSYEMSNATEISDILPPISHVRCALHTLQLAIEDGLKKSHPSALIGRDLTHNLWVSQSSVF